MVLQGWVTVHFVPREGLILTNVKVPACDFRAERDLALSESTTQPDGLPDATEERQVDEDGEGADEGSDDPVALLEAEVLVQEGGEGGRRAAVARLRGRESPLLVLLGSRASWQLSPTDRTGGRLGKGAAIKYVRKS